MPRSLQPIPAGTPISETDGTITTFFRLAWQALVDGFTKSPLAAALTKTAQNAALPTTLVLLAPAEGIYRMNFYTRVTTPDGISSSLAVKFSWVDGGVTLTATSAAVTGDAVSSVGTGTQFVHCDGLTNITVETLYASNTPGAMKYRLDVGVEQCL